MTEIHVSFEKMSDLIDEDLPVQEKEAVLFHLDSCPECRKEMIRLRSTVDLCVEFGESEFDLDGLCDRVVGRVRFRRRARMVMKFAPAAAAAVVLFAGYTLFFPDQDRIPPGGDVAVVEKESYNPVTIDTPRPVNDVEQVIGILRDGNATITNVSDLYVEGKIPVEKFERLRRHLGFRQVAFSVMDERPSPGVGIMPSYMEEVGSDNGFGGNRFSYGNGNTGGRYIRFRVFR